MVSSYKYFRFPFAVSGTVAAIPDTVQGDGSVSYPEGFGPDYALDPATQPAALNIPRDKSNQLYFDITDALQYIQQGGIAEWITNADNGGSAFSYAKNSTVLYTDGIIYQSLIAANNVVPGTDATKWIPVGAVGSQAQAGNWATETGSGNAFVIAPLPAIAAYANGQVFRFAPTHVNTAAATLAVNGLAAKSIVLSNGDALRPGDIPSGGVSEVIYNATLGKFVLTSPGTPVYSVGSSGYLRIPGTPFILQWASWSFSPANTTNVPPNTVWATGTVSWPITFPVGGLIAWAAPIITTNGQYVFASTNALTATNVAVAVNTFNTATLPVTGTVFALGT